ncbi:hypothetical protein AAHE18_20G170500 [Arachis hypogaea]
MENEFEMSLMGEINFFLGLQIKQTPSGTFIHQGKYAKELIKKFGLESSKLMGTPMHPNTKLEKDDDGKDADETRYRGMIGSLMYLTSSRPDIVQSVGVCSRFQSHPKESHLSAIKCIIRYIKETSDYGLWYPKSDDFSAVGFCDADYTRDRVDRRSTSGMSEAEYISASACCSQLIWLKTQLEDYKLKINSIPLFCDNMSAINISKNHVLHSITKNIEIKYHFIRKHVQKGTIGIQFVKSEDQLADIFTKPLCEDRFCTLRKSLGMIDLSSIDNL